MRILEVRAKLKELDHDYAGALADVRAWLAAEPESAQAWIELANLHRVRGDLEASAEAADGVARLAPGIAEVLCRVPLRILAGEGESVDATLSRAIEEATVRLPELVPWLWIQRAAAAEAVGDRAAAQSHLRAGLRVAPGHLYLLRSLADELLLAGRNEEVLEQLEPYLHDTGVYLRYAIALRRAKRDEADAAARGLAERFEAVRARGGRPHGRFVARAFLDLNDAPAAALEAALVNWAEQKEVRDAELVLRSAAAAGRPESAAPVIDWIRQHDVRHTVLRDLLLRLESSAP